VEAGAAAGKEAASSESEPTANHRYHIDSLEEKGGPWLKAAAGEDTMYRHRWEIYGNVSVYFLHDPVNSKNLRNK
jgi:hypothetical protein